MKVTEDDRIAAFAKFYSFETTVEQDVFLIGLIKHNQVQRRRPIGAHSQKTKTCTFTYHLPVQGNIVKVCKKQFVNTFDLKFGRVRRLLSIEAKGDIPKRKNLGNQYHSLSPQTTDLIKEHIMSYPTHKSHYSNKTYEYLDARLTVKTMYQSFTLKYPNLNVKYNFYLKIFRQHFDLHFGRPQVDTCITCEELNVVLKNSHVSEAQRQEAEVKLKAHKTRANKFTDTIRKTKELCQTREDMVALCFDYMQNLPLPHLPVQDIFYMRQLWVNVFSVHNLKTGKSVLYVYHEGIAKKGANDVCSMLHDYIQSYIPQNISNLRLFSDGCTGQNKNHTMVRYCAALVDTGRFKNVRQYFPVRGHSYNPCDRDFGTIKRHLSKTDRVYEPMEYVTLIANSFKSTGRVEVKYLDNSDIFLNFKAWWPKFYKKVAVSEETKGRATPRQDKVMFQPTAFKEYRHSKSTQGTTMALEYINGIVKHSFKLLFSNRVTFPNQKAYQGVNPINVKKIQDLSRLTPYILEEHLPFHQSILQWPTTQLQVDDEDD